MTNDPAKQSLSTFCTFSFCNNGELNAGDNKNFHKAPKIRVILSQKNEISTKTRLMWYDHSIL